MRKKKILITGASGMLGANLVSQLQNQYDVYSTSSSDFKEREFGKFKVFDLNQEDYSPLFSWVNPDIIIHCAAITNGNFCQNNPYEAFLTNSFSCNKLVSFSNKECHIIYISTDAVFSADIHLAKESDIPNPENIYGKSKELGEFLMQSSQKKISIIRTTIVGLNLNSKKSGFAEWIIRSQQKGEKINLFEDVLFTPISIWRLGEEIISLIQNPISRKICHISGSEIVTKYDFGYELVKSLNGNFDLLTKGSIREFSGRAKRSTDQTLSCKKYEMERSVKLPTLTETVNDIKIKYNERYKNWK